MQNGKRVIVKMIKEICAEQDIAFHSFSGDWFFQLNRGATVRHIFGYDFDINSCTAHLLAKDKAAACDILGLNHIARIEHRLFHKPEMKTYIPHSGNWEAIFSFARDNSFDIVCKPNMGTGGTDVLRARNAVDLEQAVHTLFGKYRSICLSPFVQIEHEYRAIVLRNQCLLSYRKIRPSVIGDGKKTKYELIGDWLRETKGEFTEWLAEEVGKAIGIGLGDVVPDGTQVQLNWRHNLGQGAMVQVVTSDQWARLGVEDLALGAARALRLELCAVDVIETSQGLCVLEVNSGLMMERFTMVAPDGYEIAKGVYRRVISEMFQTPRPTMSERR